MFIGYIHFFTVKLFLIALENSRMSFVVFSRRAALACFLLLITAASGGGQITNVSNDQMVPTPGVGHDYIGTVEEIVNPANGSLSLRIPLPTPQGRGLSLPLQFSYNSSGIMQMYSNVIIVNGGIAGTNYYGYTSMRSNQDSRFLEQGGWSYGLPLLSATEIQVPGNNPTYPQATCPIATGFVFTDPSGSRHALNLALPNFSNCNTVGIAPGYSMYDSYTSYDRSYFAWTTNNGTTGTNNVQGLPFSISDNEGTYYHFAYLAGLPGCLGYCNVPDYMEDRNGNKVIFNWGAPTNPFPFTVIDTAGRNLVSIPSFDSAAGDQITLSGLGKPYIVKWKSIPYNISISTNPPPGQSSSSCNTPSTQPYGATATASGSMQVVSSIELPNGQSYQFQYDPTYGFLNKIIYPTGVYVKYDWGPSTQPSDAVSYADSGGGTPVSLHNLTACTAIYQAPAILHRYVSYDGQNIAQQQDFTYSTNFPGGYNWTTKQTTVTTTDMIRTGHPSFKTVYTYSPISIPPPPDIAASIASQVPVEQTIMYYDSNGSLLRTVTKSWTGQPTNPVLSEEDITPAGGQTSRTLFSYDNSNNIIEKDEFDYGQSTPIRSTTIKYQSFAASRAPYSFPPPILDHPCKTIVYAGVSSGTPVTESDAEYDDGTTVCGAAGTSSVSSAGSLPSGTHDETNFGTNSAISRGNLTTMTRKCLHGCTSDSTTTYRYDETGQIQSMVDPKSNLITYSYRDSPSGGNAPGNSNAYLSQIVYPTVNGVAHTEGFSYNYSTGNLTQSIDQNNKATNYQYNDPLARLTEGDYPDRGITKTSYQDSSPVTVTTTIAADPDPTLVSTTVADGFGRPVHQTDPGSNTVDTVYDGEGNIYTLSNSHGSSSSATNGTTTYTYDSLGRETVQTNQDNSTEQWNYTGNVVDFYDETGRHWQRTYDALGRLTKVLEPDSSNNPTIETDYEYDALNNLGQVDQWAGANGSGGDRRRTFVYDSLSRLQTATNPESGTTSYTYDANGNIQTKTDARGVTTSYTYDALNRLLSKTYSSDPNKTALSCYQYDQSSLAGSSANLIGRLANEWTQSLSSGACAATLPGSGYVTRRSILSYDPMGRVTSEQQCTPSNCTTTTPYALTYGYDLAGNLGQYTNGIGSIMLTPSYDEAGRLNQILSSWQDTTHPSPLFSSPTYYPGGQLQRATYGNGLTINRTYDNRLRITGETDSGQVVPQATAGSATVTITGAEQSH